MLLAITLLACLIGASQGICPPEDWIEPYCTCQSHFGDAVMTCSNLYCPDELLKPLQMVSVKKYHIFSLQIENSSLLYIPHNAFKGGNFERIRFFRSEIMSLSDIDIAFEGLEETLDELRATEANFVTQWDWQQLRRMNKLRLIDINMINLGSIDQVFPPLKSLNALGITKAGISYIVDHAFENLSALRILSLVDNNIEDITRNMLPNPAPELAFLDFSNNEIKTIPKNFFTNMPKLVHVSLTNNKLIVLPEDTYSWAIQHLEALLVGGNKFVCDCRMRWLIGRRRPYEFTATCASPRSLAGQKVGSIEFKEFRC
ncbi:leucine-rich repeats and immunoglobulin-like domains protein 1 [Argiope bruennichi]|uniref:leucine-rich repeats and immunoglobulin-like domains protein 1 n=1 Tax=Argiope bruennichi TaxID=94029 RepID=UPI00249589D9|nr:leucine-rich repeats and immunoglobulin-like domains protein 1 [Argiope bruennichi]